MPDVRQVYDYDCGAAAVLSVIKYFKVPARQFADATRDFCGGVGGKPGPCPTGVADDDAPKRVSSKIGGHNVVMEVGADGAAKVVEGPDHLVGKTFKKKAGPPPVTPEPKPSAAAVSSAEGGPRKSKATVETDGDASSKRNWESVSGGLPEQECASLVGAPDAATVTLDAAKDKAYITVDHPEYTARRVIASDAGGSKYVKNDTFFLKESKAKGTGLGSRVFSDQVANLSATAGKTGIKYIQCSAARYMDDGKQANGYYTWPRMGYDQSLSDHTDATPAEKQTLATAAKKFEAKTVLDVMKTKEGRDWWKENGCDLRNMKFDLAADSRSMKIHQTYMDERKTRPMADPLPSKQEEGAKEIEEIELSDDDERALDAAWEKLSNEHGEQR